MSPAKTVIVQLKKRRISRAVLVAIGLAMASGQGVAAPKCTLVRIEEWPIRLVNNRLIVDGTINGQKINIILDTGSPRSLMPRASAMRLELPRHWYAGERFSTVGGTTDVEYAHINEFAIGKASRNDWNLAVAGEHGDAAYDVALADDFFAEFDVEFDLAHNAVRLFQPEDCDGVSLAYWTTGAVGEVWIAPVTRWRPETVITVEINGRRVRAMLSSGSTASLLTKETAASVGVTPETPGTVPAKKTKGLGPTIVDTWIGTFQSFVIGNETIRDTPIRFADLFAGLTYDLQQQLPQMLLGVDFLRAHRVLVAHSQRKLYFTYAGGPVFQSPPTASAPAAEPPQPGNTPPAIGEH